MVLLCGLCPDGQTGRDYMPKDPFHAHAIAGTGTKVLESVHRKQKKGNS